jgi:hypothetical protein
VWRARLSQAILQFSVRGLDDEHPAISVVNKSGETRAKIIVAIFIVDLLLMTQRFIVAAQWPQQQLKNRSKAI